MPKKHSWVWRHKLLLALAATAILAVIFPEPFFTIINTIVQKFWKVLVVVFSAVSVEAVMIVLRGRVGLSRASTRLFGLCWVNLACVWWTFFFTITRWLGPWLLQRPVPKNLILRWIRKKLEDAIRFATIKTQSSHRVVRLLRRLVSACQKRRWLLMGVFFLAGFPPHADAAAIFVAVTYGYPMLVEFRVWGRPVFQLPRLVLFTALGMNCKILLWDWLLAVVFESILPYIKSLLAS